MNIQLNISEELWNAVQAKYENADFTGAIRDAFVFLSNILRDKADISGDGIDLINKSFSDSNPKIKINKLETQSEIDEQKGTANLLRGLYQSIRNPRSHEKVEDNEEVCNSIIGFIDYIYKRLKESFGQFRIEDFIDQVIDKRFVRTAEYCEALVKEIPDRKFFDTIIAIYKQRNEIDIYNLSELFNSLYMKMSEANVERFLKIVSDDLRKTSQDQDIKYFVKILKPIYWKRIDQIARLRTENRIIESIRDAHYLATWATDIFNEFSDKNSIFYAIDSLVNSDESTKYDYFFKHMQRTVINMVEYSDLFDDKKQEKNFLETNATFIFYIRDKIKDGDKYFYEQIKKSLFQYPIFIKDYFNDVIHNFQEKVFSTNDSFEEDIPF